ncbi:MAG: hypothetical protein AB1767_13480 [Bacillota bacterium]
MESGVWAGIAIQPWRGIYPDYAAKMVLEYGVDRLSSTLSSP